MRVYNIDLSYQPIGAQLLMIMRGKEEDMELAYNGFYNFGGTHSYAKCHYDPVTNEVISCSSASKEGSHLDYTSHQRNVATFFSSFDKLYKFFFNKTFHKYVDSWPKKKASGKRNGIYPFCHEQAQKDIETLRSDNESFACPTDKTKFFDKTYEIGTITAEKPDNSFEDEVIINSFRNKQDSPNDLEIETDNEESLLTICNP